MTRDDKALFRYRLIAPLLDPDLKRGEKNELFAAIADKIHHLATLTVEENFSC